jgi:hypothetical protein
VVSVVTDSSVHRMLQDGAAQSEFSLEVGLQGINDLPTNDSDYCFSGSLTFVGRWWVVASHPTHKPHHTHGTSSAASSVATAY